VAGEPAPADARAALDAGLALLPLALLAPSLWPAGLCAAALVAAGCVLWFRRRLGGQTPDCLGATQQMAEAAILLALLGAA
jgi:adenosylcobinamide-GDP ribazoletransferase